MNTNLSGITWRGPQIDDAEMLESLPRDLQSVLLENNGLILHHGALHVRGACTGPSWHALRVAWHEEHALSRLYSAVLESDVPFAQDQVGDQYLLRGSSVIHLDAETGEVDEFALSLAEFLSQIEADIEEYLNVSTEHSLAPGMLFQASPPFVLESDNVSLQPCPAQELITFHADFARQIRDVADGDAIRIDVD